jgi:putative nucleotidyltransferase with HDIG domain
MQVDQQQILEAVEALAPLPATVTRMAGIVSRFDWDVKEIEEAVALDPVLTAKILVLANSALAARGHEIASVRAAVMRIGAGPLFSMAMSIGMQKQFKRPLLAYGMSEDDLWVHSVATGLAAEELQRLRRKLPVESFAAALLHDVGKLVLSRFIDPVRVKVLNAEAGAGGVPHEDAELEILGVRHGEIGAAICDHWQLSPPIREGIQHHHRPGDSREPVARIVHVANAVANHVGARRAGQKTLQAPAIDPAARDELKLTDPEVASIAEGVHARLDDVLRRYA